MGLGVYVICSFVQEIMRCMAIKSQCLVLKFRQLSGPRALPKNSSIDLLGAESIIHISVHYVFQFSGGGGGGGAGNVNDNTMTPQGYNGLGIVDRADLERERGRTGELRIQRGGKTRDVRIQKGGNTREVRTRKGEVFLGGRTRGDVDKCLVGFDVPRERERGPVKSPAVKTTCRAQGLKRCRGQSLIERNN